jgi:predicted adenine nucleotide alpha hydrolase (AANH) superfamily ATPase
MEHEQPLIPTAAPVSPARVLLHTCCGPCSTYPVPWLREAGYEVTGYFYNPNIHPFTEYEKREDGMRRYAELMQLRMIFDPAYQPLHYFQAIAFRESRRCFMCYQLRLERTAHIAQKGGFDFFSTTMLVSKYQQHVIIKETAEAAAEKYGVPFLYQDFREGFAQTGERSRELGLYRQQYCGCLYSEIERYAPKPIKKLVK